MVLFHSPYSFSGASIKFIANSYLFVDFFFILSGFVMSYAYADKISNGMPLKVFVALRLGRIYPLHLFILLIFLFYTALKASLHYSFGFGSEQQFDKNNFLSFISNILLIHSIGIHDYLTWNYPSWSISAEFFTYIVFFVFLKSIDKNKGMAIPLLISIIGYCYLTTLEKQSLDITYDLGLVRCIAAFNLGVFLFRVRSGFNAGKYVGNIAEIFAIVIVILAVSIAHKGWVFQILSIATFFIALLVFADKSNGFLGKLLHSQFMRHLGIWSYSIYMTQAFVLSFMDSFVKHVMKINTTPTGINSIWLNFLAVIIIIFMSRFTFLFIEDKYRKLVKSKIHEVL